MFPRRTASMTKPISTFISFKSDLICTVASLVSKMIGIINIFKEKNEFGSDMQQEIELTTITLFGRNNDYQTILIRISIDWIRYEEAYNQISNRSFYLKCHETLKYIVKFYPK